MTTMREHALAHAARGFRVFPIRAGAKAPPLVNDWPALATDYPAQIERWWDQWPEANVGIHCDGMLVIDVDPKKGGFDSLALFEQEVELDATYEVETPSGGRHIYYRCATGARNGVDVLGTGLDIRTTAGYVLAAGSQTAAGAYRVYADEPIADCAPDLVERCAARERYEGAALGGSGTATDADAAVARAVDYLGAQPAAVQGQGGDHHTFRTICRIRDFGVPKERAPEALQEWNARCEPPWDQGELAVKIENAYAYAQDAAGKLTPEALGFEEVDNAEVIKEAQSDNPKVIENVEMLHPADVGLDEVLRVEYLIKGVLERQSNAVLFGKWNVGKTFVILDMAAAIATGQLWFGKRVRKGRVLYLGYEGIRAMKKRILALRGKHPMLLDRATPFAWAPLRNPLTRPEGVKEIGAVLVEFAARHGGAPDLIVIDPLQNALGGDDSDANLMAELNRCVAEIMRRQHCSVLRVHHAGHSNEDRARGHSSLPAGVDTEIRVDEQEIATTKQRDDVRAKFGFKLRVVKVGKDTDGDEVSTCVVEQIVDNPMSPDLSGPQRELLDRLLKLRGDGGKVSNTDIKDCCDAPAPKRREMVVVLETKQFLRAEGKGWILAERGPMAIFD
jgi:hypothetical protein